jgi:hypothetical protein
MKVFWSWQADTPGKTGRHFVREALAEAIAALKQPEDVEEPSERETREALHLDHDRQGVPGSPDLAPTIFRKIDQAAVFVVDVTLVVQMEGRTPTGGEVSTPKKLINSNVAIEYGYALHALGDASILTVQNMYYGEREELPFDLKHKAGPIQYRLPSGASKQEISAERAKLRGTLVEALRPYLGRGSIVGGGSSRRFEEVPCTANGASFWSPGEVLARIGSNRPAALRHPSEEEDAIDYRFDAPRAFYLRVIPTIPLDEELGVTTLFDVVQRRDLVVLTRAGIGGMPDRNRFGAIIYEPDGTSPTPRGFTQLFRNGEIWGVSGQFAQHYYEQLAVPMVNVENIFKRALANYVSVAGEKLGIAPPYQVEMGAVGLKDMRLILPQPIRWEQISEPIYENELKFRRVVNDISRAAQQCLVEEFLRKLYDLAGVTR